MDIRCTFSCHEISTPLSTTNYSDLIPRSTSNHQEVVTYRFLTPNRQCTREMSRLCQQLSINRWKGGSYKLYPQRPLTALHAGFPLTKMGHQNYPINHQEIPISGHKTLIFRGSLSSSLTNNDITKGKWGPKYH
jgi:hypothetical protein